MIINLNLSNGKQDRFVDYYSSGSKSIVSKNFCDFINELNVDGIQFLEGTEGNVIKDLKLDYYYIHIFKRISCVDRNNSILDINEETNRIRSIKKFSIDSEVLKHISIEERLMFFLDESVHIKLFHETIVRQIISSGMKGFKFVKVSEWGEGSAFD